MKKLISLILCLLLCFTFIVSCEKEEEPTSSVSNSVPSSSSSTEGEPKEQSTYKGIEPDGKVLMAPNQPHYYYMTPLFACSGTNIKGGNFIIDDLEELESEFSRLGVELGTSFESFYITEKVFETHYILLLINYDLSVKSNPAKTIGYRDAFKMNGKYAVYADVLAPTTGYIGMDNDGMALYSIMDNSGVIFPETTERTGSCRLLFVPKGDIEGELFDGDLLVYYTVYPD